MPTIKRKVEMNLPELIEWGWDNEIKNERFIADKQLINIEFDDTGDVLIYGNSSIKTVKFSIEVEEEITEDTVIDEMLLVYDNGVTHIAENKNLSFISKSNLKSAYYMNDDLRLILFWRDGRLIE